MRSALSARAGRRLTRRGILAAPRAQILPEAAYLPNLLEAERAMGLLAEATIVLRVRCELRAASLDRPALGRSYERRPDTSSASLRNDVPAFQEADAVGAASLRVGADVELREPDGAFVNAALVRDGYARTLAIAPNVAHSRQLAQLAQAARQSGRGLWAACGME